jgi:toxin ParE1/3/4
VQPPFGYPTLLADGGAVHVRWLRRAPENVDEGSTYVATNDPVAGARLVERIVSSVERLKNHPAAGRPGRLPNTRELVVAGTPYIVPYRIRGQTVEILGFFMARENGRAIYSANDSLYRGAY